MATTSRSYRVNLQYVVDTKSAKASLDSLQKSLENIQKIGNQSLNIDADYSKIVASARDLEAALQSAVNVNTGKLNLYDFSKSLQAANIDLKSMMASFSQIPGEGIKAQRALTNMIATADMSIVKSQGMFTKFATTLKNSFNWTLASNAIHAVEGQISSAVRYVEDLNEALTSIRVVTGKSVSDMADFAKQANQSAQSLSTTTKAFAEASLIYFQQGDKQAEAMRKAEITTKAANVAFSASTKEMSEMLTAVWNSYKVGGDQLQEYVDVMAALGAATASSTEEIATAMQKVAATANTVGVSMKQMSSIISTVASVTREAPSVIGTAYKTILARMGDLKLGETLEDGLNLGQVSSQLAGLGINILDANQNLRDMGSVIEEIGTKWQGMSQAQKSALAQVLAGKRQYTQLIALFENFDQYRNNMNIAENSKGTLNRQNQIWAEGYEAAAKRSKAAMEELYSTLINDQAMIKFQNSLTEVLKLVNNIVKGFGGLPGILLQVSSLMTKTFNAPLITKVANIGSNIGLNLSYIKNGTASYLNSNNERVNAYWKYNDQGQREQINNTSGMQRLWQVFTGNGPKKENLIQVSAIDAAIERNHADLKRLSQRQEVDLTKEQKFDKEFYSIREKNLQLQKEAYLGSRKYSTEALQLQAQNINKASEYRGQAREIEQNLRSEQMVDNIVHSINAQYAQTNFGTQRQNRLNFQALTPAQQLEQATNGVLSTETIQNGLKYFAENIDTTALLRKDFDALQNGIGSDNWKAAITKLDSEGILERLGSSEEWKKALSDLGVEANASHIKSMTDAYNKFINDPNAFIKNLNDSSNTNRGRDQLFYKNLNAMTLGGTYFSSQGKMGSGNGVNIQSVFANGNGGAADFLRLIANLPKEDLDKLEKAGLQVRELKKAGDDLLKGNKEPNNNINTTAQMIQKVTTATLGLRSAIQGFSSGRQIMTTFFDETASAADKFTVAANSAMNVLMTGIMTRSIAATAAAAIGTVVGMVIQGYQEEIKRVDKQQKQIAENRVAQVREENEKISNEYKSLTSIQGELDSTNNLWRNQEISAKSYENQLLSIAQQLDSYSGIVKGLTGDYQGLAIAIQQSVSAELQRNSSEAESNLQKAVLNRQSQFVTELKEGYGNITVDANGGINFKDTLNQSSKTLNWKQYGDLFSPGGALYNILGLDQIQYKSSASEKRSFFQNIGRYSIGDLAGGLDADYDNDKNLFMTNLATTLESTDGLTRLFQYALGIDADGHLTKENQAQFKKVAKDLREYATQNASTSFVQDILGSDTNLGKLINIDFGEIESDVIATAVKQFAAEEANKKGIGTIQSYKDASDIIAIVEHRIEGIFNDDIPIEDYEDIAAEAIANIIMPKSAADKISAAKITGVAKARKIVLDEAKKRGEDITATLDTMDESLLLQVDNYATFQAYSNPQKQEQIANSFAERNKLTASASIISSWRNRRSKQVKNLDIYDQLVANGFLEADENARASFIKASHSTQTSILDKEINKLIADFNSGIGNYINDTDNAIIEALESARQEKIDTAAEMSGINTEGKSAEDVIKLLTYRQERFSAINSVKDWTDITEKNFASAQAKNSTLSMFKDFAEFQEYAKQLDDPDFMQSLNNIIADINNLGISIKNLTPANLRSLDITRTAADIKKTIETLNGISLDPKDWKMDEIETNLQMLGDIDLDKFLQLNEIEKAALRYEMLSENVEQLQEKLRNGEDNVKDYDVAMAELLAKQSKQETDNLIIDDYNRQLEVMEEKWDKVSESISGATNKLQDFLSNLDKFNTLTEIEELRQQFKDAGIEANKAEELIERMTNKNNSKESRIIAAAEADSLLSLYNMRTVNERQAFTSWDSSISEKAGYVTPTIEINSPDTSNIEAKQDTIAENTTQIAADVATIAGEKTGGQSKDIDSEKVASQKRTNEINQQIEELRRQGKLESENRGLYELRRTGGGKLTYGDIIAEKERLEEEIKTKKEEEERRAILEKKQIESDSHTGGQRSNLENVRLKMSSLFPNSNVDLFNRVKVPNSDGTYSTLESESIGYGDSEYLYTPITSKGKKLSEEQIISYFDTISKMAENLGSSIEDVDKLYGLSLIIDSVKPANLTEDQLNNWRTKKPEQLHELQQYYYDHRFNPIQDLFYDYNNKWNVRGREEEWDNWADTYLDRTKILGAKNKANDFIQAAIATSQMPQNKNTTIDDLIASGQVNAEKVEYDQIRNQLAAHGESIPEFEEALTQAIENAIKEAAERAEELRVDQEDKFYADETKKGVDAWREEQRAIQEQKEAERVAREDAYFAEESQRGLNQLYKEWEAKNLELMENGNFIPSSLQELMSKDLSEDQAKLADGLFEKYISLADSIKKNPEKFQAEKAQLDANVKQLVEIVEASMQSAADAADNHLAAVLEEAGTSAGKIETSMLAAAESAKVIEQSFTKKDKFEAWKNSGTQQVDLFDDILGSIESGDFDDAATAFNALRQSIPQENWDEIGGGIIEGINTGLQNKINDSSGEVLAAAVAFRQNTLEQFLSAFAINSPSPFFEPIGAGVAEGCVKGFLDANWHFPAGELKDQWYKDIAGIAEDLIKARNEELDAKFQQEYVDQRMTEDLYDDPDIQRRALEKNYKINKNTTGTTAYKFREQKIKEYDEEHAEDHGKISAQAFMEYFNSGDASAQFKDSMQKIAQKLWGDAWNDRFQNLTNNLDDWDVFSKWLDFEIALNTEELQKQWQINLTHMVDRFQSALDQIGSLNQEKAKQVRDYWLQTYEDIAKAQEAAFEGKSLSESSSLEAQQRFVKQFLANGGREDQVRELLTTTDINTILAATENSLSLSEMNANNREMVNDEGLAWNKDNTLAPGQTYAQYQEKWMNIFAKEIKDGGDVYKDSQLKQIQQIIDIVNRGDKLDTDQQAIWDLLTNEEDPWKGLTQNGQGKYEIDENQLASALVKISDRVAHTSSEWLGRKATAATNESNNKSILQREVLSSGNLYQTQNEAIVSMIKKTKDAWDWGSGTKNNLDRIFESDAAGRQMFETYFGKDVEIRYEDFQNALDYLAQVLRENAMAIAATKSAIENGEASDIAFTRDGQGVLRPNVSYDENGAIRGVQAYNIKSWEDLSEEQQQAFKVKESDEIIAQLADALVEKGFSNEASKQENAKNILQGNKVFNDKEQQRFEQMLAEGGGIFQEGFGIRAAGGGTDNNQYSIPTWLTVDENNKTGNANIDQYIQAENERRVSERMTNLQSDLGFNETGTLMFISNWSDTAKQWLESQGRANESLTQLDWAALDAATKLKMLAEAEDYRRAQMGSDALFGPEGQGGLIAQYDKLVRGGATNETRDLIATKSELVEAISAVYNASPEVAVKLVDNDRKLLVDLANGVKNKNDKQIGKASGQIVDKLYEYDAESVRAKGAKAAEGIRGQRHGIDNNNLTNMRRAKMFDSAFDNIDINHEHLDEMWKGAGKTGAQAYADAFSAGLKRDFKPSDGMKGLNEAVQNAANLGKDSSKIFSTMYNNLSDELKSTYKNGEDYARQMTTEAQATFDSVKATQGEAAAIQNLQQSTGLEYEVVELEPGEMPDQEGAIHLGPATETTTISGNAKINSSEMTVSGALQGQVNFGEVNMPITGQKTETKQGTNQEVTQEGGQQAQAKQRYLVPKGTKLHNKQIPAPSNNGGGKKGGGGGGGGKSAKHEKHATYKSSIPRYHRTNSHIENLSKTLNKVDSVKQRMYGKKLLDNMKTEIDYLKEQEKWYKTLLVEAKEWEKFDRELLTKNFSNVQFDEDGSIKNYVEVMKSIVDEYNKAVDKFNASEQEEADSNALSDAKEKMEEQKKLIENYEESIGKIHEAQNSILETQNKMADAQLEMIQTKLQNVTDWTQKERDLLEYINTKYEETLRKQSTVLTNYITSVQSLDNDLSHMTSTFAELNQAYANGDIFQAQYVQGLQDLQDQILETLNSIEDMRKSIKELYGDTLELWNDGISKNTDLIKQQTSALNTFIDMTKLQYGDASYPQLQGYYNDVLNINREMAAINKQNYQVLADQLPYYEQQMRLGEVSKENYELLLTQASEMRQAWLESIADAMQSAKDALANEISSIVQELNKAFAGAFDDVDYLQEQFDRFIENRDLTLTATEQGYEIAKLNRQIDKDLSDTESEWLKNELRSLQDIINAENTQNRLTQYEIDKLQKQYEITKALADLEDARAAKDVVRLTRDENGNFMYQYTADTDKINDAEQAYEDRVFEMYQLVKEHADSVQQAALENMSYFTSQLEEIMNNSELTNEQKIARLTDLYQDFAEKAQFYAEDLAQTMNDLSRWNGNTTYPLWDINNRSTTEEVNGNVAQMLTNGASIMQAAVTALGTDENGNPNGTGALGALASYQKAIDEINEDAQLSDMARVELMARMSYEASYAKEQMTDLNTQFTDVSNEIRTVVTAWDNFNTKLEKTVELMQGIFNQAQQFIQAEIGDTSLGNYAPITGNGRFAMTSSIAGNTFGRLNLKTDTGFSFLDYLEEYTSGGSHEAQEDLLRSIWETFLIETSSGSKVGGTAKKMATGGLNDYTGLAWLDGTFTRPELVLNADDTQRMFDIIDSERAISEPMLSNIVSLIDTMANVSGISSGRFNSVGGNAQQQNVTINADFPNVSSRDEIKAAFGDIMNMASQYINSGAY